MKATIVLVSYVACLLIVFALVPAPSPSVYRGRVAMTKAYLRLLQNAMSQFKMDAGRLPTQSEGLNALVQQPANVLNWPAGGHLETSDLPKDGWGNEFVYVLDSNLPSGFGIFSCGEDGVTSSRGNDRDDLNTCRTHPLPSSYYETRLRREAGISRAAWLMISALGLAVVFIILWKESSHDQQST